MPVAYVCGDIVGSPGGAGAVTANELRALEEALDMRCLVMDGKNILPPVYQGLDLPFLQDYFVTVKLPYASIQRKFNPECPWWDDRGEPRWITNGGLTHVHFYSNGFSEAVSAAKRQGAIVTYTTPSHNPQMSIQEYQKQATLNEGPAYPHHHISNPSLYRLHSRGLLEADLVIVPSTLSEDVVREIGVDRIKVIPHGTDLPETVPPMPEKFAVGYLGQIGPDKGLSYLIEAWSKLAYPDAVLMLAGWGTERLEKMVRQYSGKGRFHLMGSVKEPGELFRQVSIYCQPSTSEGFGISVVEALAHGRPVVCSRGAGAADAVREGIDGFTVPAGDTNALAEAIDSLRKDTKLSEAMAVSARDRAKEYSWDRIRAIYKETFRKLHHLDARRTEE